MAKIEAQSTVAMTGTPSPSDHVVTAGQGGEAWQDMSVAPKDGKHCILAIKTGAFVYAIQGAFMNGKWMNAADIDAEPLCWMPNTRIPAEFLPWTDEFKARAALSTPTPKDVGGPADQIIGQIEELFPNWRSYRDLIDCIECTLHRLKDGSHVR